MSMREEDRQKNNNCPSRGLGLAAAALGVGVGAALYYFLSKKPENPDGEGSTTGWSCEQPHTLSQEERDILRAQALSEEEQIKFLNAQKFRERSWSLEECSICFEIMLKDQDLTSLPCAHNFHSACLAPWLAEQQTCPNCRKAAE
ncbi:E3 ubiquitin-protein ligase RLIM-like isoform X1 [Cydia fagiglandana]|uniref:E3 ubiquitin-protein ligase RLIM-like isoform X1 n=1 Tax=Cydia fagiglandana TaxID=1458189 RepID=UPI002FEDE9AD